MARTTLRAARMLVAMTLVAGVALAAPDEDLGELDLEALMDIPVTSVAGVPQPLRNTAAAIYVITQEDIRRGGHRTIADALRMVPGVNVAQIGSSIWAVSARGFNERFSTKLLVLIDGRAVYNSLFSGVFWDEQDLVLADVDRIEVIRGPGATLWGANAVNGVINIVTKESRQTQGFYATAGSGNHERGFGTVRYGGKLGEDRHYRVYAKYFDRDSFEFKSGQDAGDEWDVARGGFRFDFESNPDVAVRVQGDFFDGTVGSPIITPFDGRILLDTDIRGWNLQTRVERLRSPDAGWTLQAYYDMVERDRPGFLRDERGTLDIEFRQHFTAGKRHSLMWGVGYRYRPDETDGSPTLSYDPQDRQLSKYSAFVQDTIAFMDDRVSLMVGSKFEHNEFTGFEFQPNARLAWRIDDRRTAWISIARAVRTPSRGSADLILTRALAPVPTPTPARLLGNPNVEAENLHAYEFGYRFRPIDELTLDIATFFNDYDQLISIGALTSSPFDRTFSNETDGESYGAEVTARWDPTNRVRLTAGYSFLRLNEHGIDEGDEDTNPEHQFNLRSYFDIADDWEFNSAVYYVDDLKAGNVSSYLRVDLGASWRPSPNVEIALWGQNLQDSGHTEFVDGFFVIDPIEIGRSIYGQVSVHF